MASTALPDIHNDPFDRIIMATAQLNGMAMLSKDGLSDTIRMLLSSGDKKRSLS